MVRRTRKIYALRNNRTGKFYVGSTVHFEDRIQDHIRALRRGAHPVPLMQAEYDAFGDDYSYFLLEELPDEIDRAKREYYWMTVFNSRDPEHGYNYRDKAKPVDLGTLFMEHKIPPKADVLGVTVDDLLREDSNGTNHNG